MCPNCRCKDGYTPKSGGLYEHQRNRTFHPHCSNQCPAFTLLVTADQTDTGRSNPRTIQRKGSSGSMVSYVSHGLSSITIAAPTAPSRERINTTDLKILFVIPDIDNSDPMFNTFRAQCNYDNNVRSNKQWMTGIRTHIKGIVDCMRLDSLKHRIWSHCWVSQ